MGKHGDGNMDETGETRGEPGGKPARGTGTCEEIDPRNFADDPKCIRLLRSPFRTVLIDKFLKADSVEIANRHFFTRSSPLFSNADGEGQRRPHPRSARRR